MSTKVTRPSIFEGVWPVEHRTGLDPRFVRDDKWTWQFGRAKYAATHALNFVPYMESEFPAYHVWETESKSCWEKLFDLSISESSEESEDVFVKPNNPSSEQNESPAKSKESNFDVKQSNDEIQKPFVGTLQSTDEPQKPSVEPQESIDEPQNSTVEPGMYTQEGFYLDSPVESIDEYYKGMLALGVPCFYVPCLYFPPSSVEPHDSTVEPTIIPQDQLCYQPTLESFDEYYQRLRALGVPCFFVPCLYVPPTDPNPQCVYHT